MRAGLPNPSGNWTIVFVGPQDLPSECTTTGNGGVCEPWPIMRLGGGEVVVAWRFFGMPGGVAPTGGTHTTAGGRPSLITRGPADSGCLAIGGDESISAVVSPITGRVGWLAIDACLAGPDLRAGEAAYDAMLASSTIP